jgi:hypothetical protein
MANQPEVAVYDSGVYQIEVSDPVDGGVGAKTNAPLLALANRTAYLKAHLDAIEGGAFLLPGYALLDSPALINSPTAPTQAAGDNSTKIATDAFVQTAVNGSVSVSVAGGATTTLTQAQYGASSIVLTGAITANKAVVLPNGPGRWLVTNNTTGAFTITLKTAAGTGVVVTQGKSTLVFSDGTNVRLQQSDFVSPALLGTPTAPTAAPGTSTTQLATTEFVTLVQGLSVPQDSSVGAAQLPTGTNAQRPANGAGKLRFNTDINRAEINNGAAWGSLGGATGGGNDAVFYLNDQTINNDYTVAANQNAMSAGPITIANGKTVTVSTGAVWTVV